VATPASGPLFGDVSGFVLLFDDGIDGVLALDPDNRVASRSVVMGQRAGDQPYRLHRVSDSIVTGWGEVYSTNLLTGQATSIGTATISLPAAEPDRVWLIDWPGGRVGVGTPSAWQVDANGVVLTQPQEIQGSGIPALGVPGGLAIETDDGIRLWYPGIGLTAEVLGVGAAHVAAASQTRLAYCRTDRCVAIEVLDFVTTERLVIRHPDGSARQFYPDGARFSPDGQRLALPVLDGLVVADLVSGQAVNIIDGPIQSWLIDWSPGGEYLFAAQYSYGDTINSLRRYDPATGAIAEAWVPFGGTLDFIVLGPGEAVRLIRDQDQPPQACPPVFGYPSGREGICGFRF
jgi:hypothetical protein